MKKGDENDDIHNYEYIIYQFVIFLDTLPLFYLVISESNVRYLIQ